jgi:ketosteroid isomerase-like protein
MGQAREVMDGITAAVTAGDRETLLRLYAPDAVVEAPDAPRIEGAAAIADYHLSLKRAFPDASYEYRSGFEIGDTAIDEGWFVGTHTDVLSTPDGDVPPTGKRLRIRACDIVEVRDGVAVAHRLFYDQLDLMTQLGLTDSGAEAGAVPAPRAAAEGAEERATTG